MIKRTTLFFAFLLYLCSVAPAQYEIMVSTDYPPYNYLNSKGELEGFNIDLLNAIQKIYNIKIEVKGADWKTANTLLSEGEIHAIAGAHYPGMSDNEFNYTRSVIVTSHCFLYNRKFRNKISTDVIRMEQNPIIVLWKNDVLIQYVRSINPNTKFVFVDNYNDLIEELEKSDITCAFSQKISSMYYASKMNKPHIKTGNEVVLERNMGFKISKEVPELSTMLNNGIEVIMSNGEYQKIYNKWIYEYNEQGNNLAHLVKYFIIAGILVLIVVMSLLFFNYMLQNSVRSRTRDLQNQLELNSTITKELEKQKFKAEESDRMKSAFLANMSHEIRTPMNGIMGFTELLKSHDYSADEQKQFVDIIHQSGERMLNTINNIIVVSKIEAGLETMHITETNIEKTLAELFNFFELEAKKKDVKLLIEKKEINIDRAFYSDVNKLNSILTNLIKNALKFTLKGYVKIGYSITNEMFSFSVTDTGIGIEEEKQKVIFNHFVQADSSITSRFEGSGLGLSICNEYTKMLNGELRVESEINKGSTFYLTLPNHFKAESVNIKPVEIRENGKPSIPAGLNIIVAEDDKTSFFYMKYILEGISAKIYHATTGFEAIDLAKNNPQTDIILMDSKMPELDGMEAVKIIREFNKNVFIIAQTGYAQAEYKAKTIEAGCNEFIEKPVDRHKLMNLIAKGIQTN